MVGVVTATANSASFFKQTGVLPQNVNYAIKEEVLVNFLRSHIDMPEPSLIERVVGTSLEQAEAATVRVVCAK